MNKIFVFAVPVDKQKGIDQSGAEFSRGIECFNGDCIGHAIAEDGEHLASHWSSSIGFFRHDMGLTSTWKHKEYTEKYPEGFELIEVPFDELDSNQEFQSAWKLNQSQTPTGTRKGDGDDFAY